MAPNTEKVEFPGASGALLSARLDSPVAPPIAYALFAHCFTCSKETRAAAYVAAALAERGIACLRFDFTGLGGSGGDFANTNFSSNQADLVAAADFLRRHYRAPEILVGHSLGGAAVLAAARDIPEAGGVAIAAPSDPAPARAHSAARRDRADQQVGVLLAGRSFPHQAVPRRPRRPTAGRGGPPRQGYSCTRRARRSRSGRDATLPGSAASEDFVSLDPADHLLTRREDAIYAGHVVAAWAERFVQRTGPEAPALAAGQVVVRETREGKLTQVVSAGRHVFRADEPVSVGGLDSGPSPYDLLLAAVGTCTSMTVRLYADAKGWPLERVEIALKHDKIHAADCADCETREGQIDRIERAIRLEGTLDAEQRAKLLEIANKCPVHRTLHSEVTIPTRLEETEPG
jgi:putative redox protein